MSPFSLGRPALAFICVGTSPLFAQLVVAPNDPVHRAASGLSVAGSLVDNVLVPNSGSHSRALTAAPASSPPLNLGGFNIVIVPDDGLAANPAALAAFDRAAQSWAARISDPITITVNAGLDTLPANVIGSTNSVALQGDYDEIRDQLVADSSGQPNSAIVSHLPDAAHFTATMPAGRTLSGNVVITKANAKAAGFTGIDQAFGNSDGTITFSNTFAFDFDHSDGVSPGKLDFETVAAHEIGHLLGFTSIVDSIDNGATSVSPFTLDLFRFADGTSEDPATAADFANFPRSLMPGAAANTDQIDGPTPEWGMSTGVHGGDGNQASHWKADDLTGDFIGIMDPTLAYGQYYGPQESDFRALDLIGYDVAPVPEPSPLGLCFAAAFAGFVFPRPRGRTRRGAKIT